MVFFFNCFELYVVVTPSVYLTSDLVEQVTNTTFSNGLALMRGFFFWLQVTFILFLRFLIIM